ncbi:hypothetical protein J4482_00045 [Candidatus Woesearchaeota archaeon]|nr:hypothetical protein [Candidatus Woesearchaeota archaeon]
MDYKRAVAYSLIEQDKTVLLGRKIINNPNKTTRQTPGRWALPRVKFKGTEITRGQFANSILDQTGWQVRIEQVLEDVIKKEDRALFFLCSPLVKVHEPHGRLISVEFVPSDRIYSDEYLKDKKDYFFMTPKIAERYPITSSNGQLPYRF